MKDALAPNTEYRIIRSETTVWDDGFKIDEPLAKRVLRALRSKYR